MLFALPGEPPGHHQITARFRTKGFFFFFSRMIDQKSSAVELCIIKVNIFYADADSLNKKSNAQWRDGNNAIVNEDGLSDRSWRSYLGMFMNKDFSMYSQH